MKKLYLTSLIGFILSCSLVTWGQTIRSTEISSNGLKAATGGDSSVLFGYCDDEFINGQGQTVPDEIQAAFYVTPE